MEKKNGDTQEQNTALPEGSSCTQGIESTTKRANDVDESPPKGEISAMKILQQSDCVGQSQSGAVESHTLDGETTGEKRPLEIRYQHHNLRSRLKKVKKAPIKKVTEAPAKKEQAKLSRSPRGEKAEGKPVKKVKRRLKRWEPWSVEDTDDFFEALCEHGRDFDSIQKHIEFRHRKRMRALDRYAKVVRESDTSKNKDQVRHFYYRTVSKVTKFVEPRADLNLKERELHALINYAELRRKLRGVNVPSHKQWRKLSELVSNGVATVRVNGRNMRLRTPVCKALLSLEDNVLPMTSRVKQERPPKLPPKVTIDLRPCDNATWSAVQSMSYNPRIRMNVCIQKKLASLIRVLSSRMIPDNIKTEVAPKSGAQSEQNIEADMLFELPGNTRVVPYEDICGRYILDGGRTLIKLNPEQIPEGYHKRTIVNDEAKAEEFTKEEVDGPDIVVIVEVGKEENLDETKPDSQGGSIQGPPTPSDDTIQPGDGGSLPPDVSASPVEEEVQDEEKARTTDDRTSLMTVAAPVCSPSGQLLGAKQGALVKSQKTGAVVGSTILMPVLPSENSNDFMSLTSISDVNILQDDVDEDESSKEATTGDSGDGAGNPEEEDEEKVFKTKDDLLRKGLTVGNCDHISLADVYLMLGKPEKLKFGYRILGQKAEKWRTNPLLSKLVMLAREEAQKAAEEQEMKKFVSVGTNTPPIKEAPLQPQMVPTQPREINLCYRSDGSTTATPILNQNGQLTLQLGSTATLSRLAPNQTIEVPGNKGKDFQFARPLAPGQVVNPRVVNSNIQNINGTAAAAAAAAAAALSNSYPMPRKRRTGRGRPSVVASQLFFAKRNIQPRPLSAKIVRAVPTGVPVNLVVSSPQQMNANISNNILAQAAISTNIAPRKIGPTVRFMHKHTINNNEMIGLSPMATGPGIIKVNNICQPDSDHSTEQVNSPTASMPRVTESNQADILSANSGNLWTLDNLSTIDGVDTTHPTATPGSLSGSPTPGRSASPHMLSVPGLAVPTSVDPVLTSTLSTPKTTPERVTQMLLHTPLSTPKSTGRGGLGNSLLNTPVIHDKMATPSALTISPPNNLTLLDMSLPSIDEPSSLCNALSGFRVRLEELTNQGGDESPSAVSGSERSTTTTVPMSVAAALTTTKILVPKIGEQSPFKAGGGNQWLHEESSQNTQMSLGSLLDQLEMSNTERKSSALGSTVSIAPPLTHNEFSRDSVMSMDSHLNAMLNENSLDYVAKFADLAAHIAASGTEDVPESSFTGQLLQTEQTVAR